MILSVGKIPFVDFKINEKYRVVDEKFIYHTISNNYMDYKPSMATVIEFIKRIDEEGILYSFDEKDYKKYQEVVKLLSLNPSSDELHKYYLKLVAKLIAFGNKEKSIKHQLSKKIEPKYCENIILEASEKKYFLKEKIVVFNDEYPCSSHLRTIIDSKYLGIENEKRFNNSYQDDMTRLEIAQKCNVSLATINRICKKYDISTTNNKKMKTIELVQEFRKNNEFGTQKECVEKTNLSLRTIKRYWNE